MMFQSEPLRDVRRILR